MHLAEGVLTLPVLGGGALLAAAGVAVGLRRLPDEHIPLAGLLCAMFFVASLIHLPVGAGSVHLVLNGLCGVLLGWAAVPVILVALLMQSLFFGYGGLTTLGVNTVVMAAPALACALLYRLGGEPAGVRAAAWRGALCGALAIALGTALMALALWLAGGRAFLPLIGTVIVAHLPVMAVEAAVTAAIVSSLARSRPALLRAGLAG
ncbi:cobalt transporter CbiM [Caldimonas thermodepolymerans]|uniref:Cobalt/nickel transport system permease protein n=1 Tax=Caldimonas thermodepolymerans TaxID=215580 RepID=A0AA46DCX5_9BURK|nr:cobalt transporter CbiM [Caldimonas thermodepolymerans]TCP05789.1 cobalt/nickel transport system permease protein [Caldimonas thermodepolymerans]UZG48269.1 cobalt transporter CbiM [Caldimonas thermodepolymerans]